MADKAKDVNVRDCILRLEAHLLLPQPFHQRAVSPCSCGCSSPPLLTMIEHTNEKSLQNMQLAERKVLAEGDMQSLSQ